MAVVVVFLFDSRTVNDWIIPGNNIGPHQQRKPDIMDVLFLCNIIMMAFCLKKLCTEATKRRIGFRKKDNNFVVC